MRRVRVGETVYSGKIELPGSKFNFTFLYRIPLLFRRRLLFLYLFAAPGLRDTPRSFLALIFLAMDFIWNTPVPGFPEVVRSFPISARNSSKLRN